MPNGPKILYLLNVSNPSRLSADSGFVVASLLAPALADAGAQVTVAAPVRVGDGRIGFVPTASPTTKYRARFDGDVAATADVIRRAEPDVVVANQIEAAPRIRAALLEAGSSATLAGYCHYLPFTLDGDRLLTDATLDNAGLGQPIILAFVAGLAALDRVLVHSATAAAWLRTAARLCGVELRAPIIVVPPPRDPHLVSGRIRVLEAGSATGVYNHRLYGHYGTANFVDLAGRLTGDGAGVLVLDLFGDRPAARSGLDSSPERFRDALAATRGVTVADDGGNRARYRELLDGAHFGIAPFRPGCPWSMSVIDCQAMSLPVISPRVGWAAEHINERLLFDTPEQAVDLVRRLRHDPAFYAEHAAAASASTEGLDPPRIAARYLEAVA